MTLSFFAAILTGRTACAWNVCLQIWKLKTVLGLVADLRLANRMSHVSLAVLALRKRELSVIIAASRSREAKFASDSSLRSIMTIRARFASHFLQFEVLVFGTF